MKIKAVVTETHKLLDGTIKGSIVFPPGTARRESVEYEDLPYVIICSPDELEPVPLNDVLPQAVCHPLRDRLLRVYDETVIAINEQVRAEIMAAESKKEETLI